MSLEKESTTYNFTFKVNDLEYKFNIVATSREDALKQVRASLASIIQEINDDLKDKPGK